MEILINNTDENELLIKVPIITINNNLIKY